LTLDITEHEALFLLDARIPLKLYACLQRAVA